MSLFAYCKKCKHLFIGVAGRALVHLCPEDGHKKRELKTKISRGVHASHYMDPKDAIELSSALARQAVDVARRSR